MFAVVEVAATVKTALVSAEVVPTATLSVRVWSLTNVPWSWNPETLEAEIAPQITLPEESVVRAFEEEQVGMVEIRRPPPLICKPPAKVEVAFPSTAKEDVATSPCTVVVPAKSAPP